MKNYNGYWNKAENPADPNCWRIVGDAVWYVHEDGRTIPSLRRAFEVIARIESGDTVPSKWLPPGVTHNPCDPDSHPVTEDAWCGDAALRKFLNLAAINVLAVIYDETRAAPPEVRASMSPVEVDRAIADRAVALLRAY